MLFNKTVAAKTKALFGLVRMERLELSRAAPLEPKSSASTNFATFACAFLRDYTLIADVCRCEFDFMD